MSGEKDTKDDGGGGGDILDHNSPYYIHASDYPRQMHVNDVLTDANYIDWSQEMQNFLFAKKQIWIYRWVNQEAGVKFEGLHELDEVRRDDQRMVKHRHGEGNQN